MRNRAWRNYGIVQSIFRYLEPFMRRDLRVWQTDRQTDNAIVNATFNYVVRPKNCSVRLPQHLITKVSLRCRCSVSHDWWSPGFSYCSHDTMAFWLSKQFYRSFWASEHWQFGWQTAASVETSHYVHFMFGSILYSLTEYDNAVKYANSMSLCQYVILLAVCNYIRMFRLTCN